MDAKETALKGLESAVRIFSKDLAAMPESAFTQNFGGKSRTVADIVSEVNLVNDHVGLTLRGEPLFDWPEGWIIAPDNLRSKAAVIESFESSSQKILDTIRKITQEDMARKVTTEYGDTDAFERCRFMTLHLWYHSGQLNYIQTMLGDDNWNW